MDITISRLPVPAVSRNGRIYQNTGGAETGVTRTDIAAPTVGEIPEQYWTSTGGTLTPTTAGDIVYVAADNPSGYVLIGTNANATGSGVSGVAGGSGAGVEGTSSSGAGVKGTSTSGNGGEFITTGSGVGGNSASVNGAAIKGSASGSGPGGDFYSTGIALKATSTVSAAAVFVSGSAAGVSSSSTSGQVFQGIVNPSTTNTEHSVFQLIRRTSGTAANNIGMSLDFAIETAGGSADFQSQMSAILTDVSSITSAFLWRLRNAGAALAEVMRLTGAGELWAKSSGLGTTVFTPLSTLDVIGSQSEEWRLQTGTSTTLSINDRSIICNTSSNAITVNLPNATTCSRRTYIIRRYTGGNNVTIDPYSSQTILGSTGSFSTLDLTNNGEWVMLTSNGADWYVLASNPNF